MKMIRNKNAAGSAPPLLILLIGPLLMGAIRRRLRSRFACMRVRAISRGAA